jgi:hypothetical protein
MPLAYGDVIKQLLISLGIAFEVHAENAAGPGGMVVAWGLAGAVLRGADTVLFHGRPT